MWWRLPGMPRWHSVRRRLSGSSVRNLPRAFNSISPYDPNVVCGNPTFCGTGVNMVCAVFDVPNDDLAVAFHYGICMDPKSCADFASRFPGGLTCYDAAMHRVAP